jgi:membrane protein DedA with SNARE-associated domain
MNVWKFSLFTFVGALPWTFGLALGGYLLGANYDDIRSVTRPFDIPIILGVLGLVGWFVWHRVREIRAESREAALVAPSSNTDESN